MIQPHRLRRPRAFTIIELLVVVAIIGILAAILIPVISKVGKTAKAASTLAFIGKLSSAIEAYHADNGAYPGPLHNYDIRSATLMLPDKNGQSLDAHKITMSENLVLGLLGGLVLDTSVTPPVVKYDRTLLLSGKGAAGLNMAKPKAGRAYVDTANLYKIGDAAGTKFTDDLGTADDSEIPEFVDTFSSPLPILYLRALPGRVPAGGPNPDINRVITSDGTTHGTANEGPYCLSQIIGYTASTIGVGKSVEAVYNGNADQPVGGKGQVVNHGLRDIQMARALTPKASDGYNGSNYYVPMDAMTFVRNPQVGTLADPTTWKPRQIDGYILISAGKDRVYGTPDDITSFGEIAP